MQLDVARRDHLTIDLLAHLRTAVPGSETVLRGSLAEGHDDIYSDIDLIWEVPDDEFISAIARLPAILTRVRPVASLRFDPNFQHSAKRRLVFVRFAGVPLFWRVDLDIFARSAGRDPDYDRDNPTARGTVWSATESSLANVIAAIKAQPRGQDDEAASLLERAEQRVGLVMVDTALPERILRLVGHAVEQEPSLAPFAADIRTLIADSF